MGLTSSTTISSTKAKRPCSREFRQEGDGHQLMMPSSRPPSTAPAMLPIPPMTAAMKHFKAGHDAHQRFEARYLIAHYDAADGASAADGEGDRDDLVDVDRHQTRGVDVNDTARMAMPVLVRCTIQSSTARMSAVTSGMIRLTVEMRTPPNMRFCEKNAGTGRPGTRVEEHDGQVLDEERGADGADHDRDARRITQRAVVARSSPTPKPWSAQWRRRPPATVA